MFLFFSWNQPEAFLDALWLMPNIEENHGSECSCLAEDTHVCCELAAECCPSRAHKNTPTKPVASTKDSDGKNGVGINMTASNARLEHLKL